MIRAVVTSPKKTFYDQQSKQVLDLVYVTPQLVVSAGPVESALKSTYQLSVTALANWLKRGVEQNKFNNWHIWNFKPRNEGGYSRDIFERKVSNLPFPDHQPPPFEVLLQSVMEVDEFLNQSASNVAILHCNAGKGRSGTVCCAYLMYKEYIEGNGVLSVDKAVELFTSKRMKNFSGAGVSIMSQFRWLEYWFSFLESPISSREVLLKRSSIALAGITIYNPAVQDVLDLNICVESYSKSTSDGTFSTVEYLRCTKDQCEVSVKKHKVDITFPVSTAMWNQDLKVKISGVCYFWFNPKFEDCKFCITWDEVDGFKGTRLRGSKMFDSMDIYWRRNP